jgi:hypothetical protein
MTQESVPSIATVSALHFTLFELATFFKAAKASLKDYKKMHRTIATLGR